MAVSSGKIIYNKMHETNRKNNGEETNGTDFFVCSTCSVVNNNLVAFIQHKTTHVNTLGSAICQLGCQKVFSSSSDLLSHYSTCHGIAFAQDRIVNTSENNEQNNSNIHETNNGQDSLNVWHSCAPEVTKLHDGHPGEELHFTVLFDTIHGKNLKYKRAAFRCVQCNFKSHTKLTLIQHIEKHHCDVSINQLTHDRGNIRNRKNKSIPETDVNNIFTCNICDKVFHKLRNLRKHAVVHRRDKDHLCAECGKRFKSSTYLKLHLRRHQSKTYSCPQCDFRSSVKISIMAHRQLHSDGSVLCGICGTSYLDKRTLTKHMEVHDATTRPFACAFDGCTWRFKSEVMCRAHFKSHTIVGKFKCTACNYTFRRKQHLQRHQKMVHGENTTSSKRGDDYGVTNENEPTIRDVENAVNSVLINENLQLPKQIHDEQRQSCDQENTVFLETREFNGEEIAYMVQEECDGLSNSYKILMPTVLTQINGQHVIEINELEHLISPVNNNENSTNTR